MQTSPHRVMVVTGAPLAGKTTYVVERKQPNDMVMDWDALAVALGSPVTHGHADALKPFIAAARDAVLERVKRGYPHGTVWIISTNPAIANEWPNARHIHLDIKQDIALARAREARPAGYERAVIDWFNTYGGAAIGTVHARNKPMSTKELSSSKWERVRNRVLSQSTICGICGKPGATTVDHIVPLSLGGEPYDLSNLRPAHAACNYSRGNGTRKRFMPKSPIVNSRNW